MKRCQHLINVIWAKAPWVKSSPGRDIASESFWKMSKDAYLKLNKEDQLEFLKVMFRQKEKEA